jgi:nitrilase
MTTVAAIQMVSKADVASNLADAAGLIAEAVEGGAKLVVLPENFAFMGRADADKLSVAEEPDRGPIQDFLAEQALRHHVWIVGGTVPLKSTDAARAWASCLVFNDKGAQVARFDKIHLFDVMVADDAYSESRTTLAGKDVVIVDTPAGRLGLAVCYDLRFPELFRRLSAGGAEIISLPSAFTAATGRAHWEVLVRARAIENQGYVIAAGQGGHHENGRDTFGDSMVVDPWGRVLSRLAQGAGVVRGEVDLASLRETRERFPCLTHRRL